MCCFDIAGQQRLVDLLASLAEGDVSQLSSTQSVKSQLSQLAQKLEEQDSVLSQLPPCGSTELIFDEGDDEDKETREMSQIIDDEDDDIYPGQPIQW